MKNHRVITVKFLAPTNYSGSRIKLTEHRGERKESKILSYDYSIGNMLHQAVQYMQSIGLNVVACGELGYDYCIMSDSFTDDYGVYTHINGKKS